MLYIHCNQLIQRPLDPLHHRTRNSSPATIVRYIARLQILTEIQSARLHRRKESIKRVNLLRHRVPAIINNDIEIPPAFSQEFLQERNIRLVAGEYRRAGGAGSPFLCTRGVVFDVVEVDVRKEFQPGVVGFAGPVVHVAAQANLEHLQRLVAKWLEIFLVHIVVAVGGDFVGAMFAGNVEKAGPALSFIAMSILMRLL